jgi:lipopolysaccharide export system ATP-binding protein
MSLLKVSGLKKRYKARTVVHDVGFEVGSGEVVGRARRPAST